MTALYLILFVSVILLFCCVFRVTKEGHLQETKTADKKAVKQPTKPKPSTTSRRPINTYSSTILRKYLTDEEEKELELEEEEREENPWWDAEQEEEETKEEKTEKYWWEIEREEEEIEDEQAEREKEEEEELLRLEEEEEFGTQDEGEWY